MKLKSLITGVFLSLTLVISIKAQVNHLPAVDIYTMDGSRVNASTISNDSTPMILVFFKTFDNTCCKNLFAISEAHEDVLINVGVKVVAICIDCIGKIEHVKPFILGHDLSIEVYIDKNGDLKRIMGIPDAPYTLLYDRNMNVYCQYNGFCPGIDEMVCEKITECLKKMEIQ